MLSKVRVVTILILCALTWYAMQITAEVRPVVIKKTLSAFPRTIGKYSLSNAFQSSAEVIEMLGVDDYIQYNYIQPDDGKRINLYVGYYESVGVNGGYHSPRNCIPGGGWGIDAIVERNLDTGGGGGETATVSKMLIRRGSEYQMVYYWYQNRGRIIASEYWEKIYQVLDAMFMGRRDGTFVRVMVSVDGDEFSAAESELKVFSEKVMFELKDYLPGAQL